MTTVIVEGSYEFRLVSMGGVDSLTIFFRGTDGIIRNPAVVNLADTAPETIIKAVNHLLSRDHV